MIANVLQKQCAIVQDGVTVTLTSWGVPKDTAASYGDSYTRPHMRDHAGFLPVDLRLVLQAAVRSSGSDALHQNAMTHYACFFTGQPLSELDVTFETDSCDVVYSGIQKTQPAVGVCKVR